MRLGLAVWKRPINGATTRAGRARNRVNADDLPRRAQIQQLQQRFFTHAGVAGHDLRALDQRFLRRQIVLWHVLLDNAHIGHTDQHIAIRVQNG